MSNRTVIIIGSGLGGLICGAILSREGYRVTVLEKSSHYGGGLQMFEHNGTSYETGFHYVGGLNKGATIYRLMNYLGIIDSLRIKELDTECFDELILHGNRYRMAIGRENFVRTLSESFPEQGDQIRRYIDDLYALCDRIPLYNLRVPHSEGPSEDEYSELSIGEFIDSHTIDPTLREVLAWNNTLYAGDRYKTQAYVAAMITKLYIEGASRFTAGSSQVADALKRVIEQGGGEVVCNSEVKRIDVTNRRITGLTTINEKQYTADHYISSIHPAALVEMCSKGAFTAAYRKRVENLKGSYSMFSLFIKMKPESFPYLNRNIYYQTEDNGVWEADNYTEEDFPRGMLIITPPDGQNQKWAERVIVHCVMRWQTVEKWSATTIGRRGEDYEEFKSEHQEKVMHQLCKLFEGLNDKIENVFCATPLTLRDYMSLPKGAVYGTIHDCHKLHESYMSTRTKIENLYLTGQNIRLHGMCGVPVTAIETCANILGMNKLIENINKY